jgi:uncharacterized protein (TIGR03435 family)
MSLIRNLLLFSAVCVAIGALTAQSSGVLDWQIAAGGKMAFEVASVKPSKVPKMPNFWLNNGDAKPPGGRLSANFPLIFYISFAYKLSASELNSVVAQLPKSVSTDAFEIEARGAGNPTKDQMRLMMQSLLADRFRLAVHFESREGPVFALTLVKPGQTGPKLRPHAEGPACPDFEMPVPFAPIPPRKAGDVFPPVCEDTQLRGTAEGTLLGSRNTTMGLIADDISAYGSLAGEVDKPVVDQTGLTGKFDFTLELPPRFFNIFPAPPNPDNPPDHPPSDPRGTSFLKAAREQLGLRLVSSKRAIRTLVVDHVERPSEN